jgi:hypothetical protein
MDYRRISSSVDVPRMQQSHVTVIGGAGGLTCDLVRCGLGAVSIVDFDRISASNPARQDFNSIDVARYKVDAIAENSKKINPEIEIESHVLDFCSISPEELEMLFGHTDLLIIATDFFAAQARGNIEALRLNKPAIWIGLYQRGLAGEIIYYVPGVTPACYRCICGSRYDAFNRGGASVSSDGGTIFDIHLVDSIAGHISLGILNRGSDNRYGPLIEQLGNRNLLQAKNDPNYKLNGKDIFRQYLGDHPANFSFTTIALPMEREIDCPDCAHLHPEADSQKFQNDTQSNRIN